MNINLACCFLFITLVFGCNAGYQNVDIKLRTDKKVYKLNDTIHLKTFFTSEFKHKITIYKELSNVDISISLPNQERLDSGDVIKTNTTKGIKTTKKNESNAEHLEKINVVIGPNRPFEKEYIGSIREDDNNYILDFEIDMGKVFFIDKNYLNEGGSVTFHGYIEPPDPPFGYSFEDYFEPYTIYIEKSIVSN